MERLLYIHIYLYKKIILLLILSDVLPCDWLIKVMHLQQLMMMLKYQISEVF